MSSRATRRKKAISHKTGPRNQRHRPDDLPAAGREECPHPYKMAYGSRAAAKRARKQFDKASDERLSPYQCPCGNWHLGRLPAEVKQGKHSRWRRV